MKQLFALAALVLALGACEARAEIDVKDDGSGTFGFSFVIEDQFLALMSGLGGGDAPTQDPFEEFKSGLKDSPVGFAIEEFKEKGARGVRASVPFKNTDELRRFMTELDKEEASSDSPFGGGGPGFGTFTLERQGGGWHFESVSDAPDLGSSFGDLGGDGGDSPFDPAQIASLLKVSFRVTLPGRTVTTTADDTSSAGGRTTFTWNADLTSKEPMKMVATTAPQGGSLPLLPIAAGAGALAILGAGFLLGRRRSAIATAGAPETPADPWPVQPGGDVPPPAQPEPTDPAEPPAS